MKLNEIRFPGKPEQKYTIYLDLDGVLADFDRGKEEILGLSKDTSEDEMFEVMAGPKGEGFYAKLKKMPDADVLWKAVRFEEVEILSAIPSRRRGIKGAKNDKINWVRKNISPSIPIHIVEGGSNKKHFAAPDRILIDDRMEVLNSWKAAGGIGVLHTSATRSIQALRSLGIL
jgi:hypothetical protein